MGIDNEELEILKNISVLVVEDDESTLNIMSDILATDVKTLYLAKNALEGLELYEEHNPDIVVTDIEMGDMNGLEMSRALKEINRKLPIIVITAFNNQEYLDFAKKIGIESYIMKPIEYDKFIEALVNSAKKLERLGGQKCE